MRPHRVEITQDGHAPGRIAAVQVAQHVLDHQFGPAVRVGGRQRVVFGQGQALRVAVHRGRRAEHQRLDPARAHRLQQPQGAQHVVVVVGQRLLHRLAHRFEAGKMDHGRGAAAFEGGLQRCAVADVAFNHPQRAPGDALHPQQRFGLAVAEVVEHRHVEARLQQFDAGVAADVTRASGDKDHVCLTVVKGTPPVCRRYAPPRGRPTAAACVRPWRRRAAPCVPRTRSRPGRCRPAHWCPRSR